MHNKLRSSTALAGVAILLIVLTVVAQENTAPPPRRRIGLALSGGGARGLAHIGVLKFLEEHRIPVDRIAGTSIGGLLAGLYATGRSAADLEKTARNTQWNDLLRSAPSYEDRPVAEKQDWNRIGGQWTLRFARSCPFQPGSIPGSSLR
jgi:NTE family protein